MGHTFAEIERRRAELRAQHEAFLPRVTQRHEAEDALRAQAHVARLDRRWKDAGDAESQIEALQTAKNELSEMFDAINREDAALVRATRELEGEAASLLTSMRDLVLPVLGLCITSGPESVMLPLASMRARYAEIVGDAPSE